MIEMVAAYHRVRPCYIGGTPLYTSNHSFSLMNYVFLCAFTEKSWGLFSNYKLQQLIINGMLKNSKVRMQKTFPHVSFLTCPITYCNTWPDTIHWPSTHKECSKIESFWWVKRFWWQKGTLRLICTQVYRKPKSSKGVAHAQGLKENCLWRPARDLESSYNIPCRPQWQTVLYVWYNLDQLLQLWLVCRMLSPVHVHPRWNR